MNERELWLELAGLRIRVSADGSLSEAPGILEGYITAKGTADHTVHARMTDCFDLPTGQELFADGAIRVFRDPGGVRIYRGEVSEKPEEGHTLVIRKEGEYTALFRREKLRGCITAKLLVNALDLPHLLTIHDGFLLHASFIEYEGKAILFTAPSETGKSTQAQLWCDHMGAALVNGDRAAVRIVDGEVYACGIPISGSSPVRRNVTLPLGAIVCLSQALENTISRLRGVRAFRRVWEGCTVNVWDRRDMELATATVSHVIARIPVYHLACTPDIRAVELLKHTMEVESC